MSGTVSGGRPGTRRIPKPTLHFALRQNHPNPLSLSTTISFDLPTATNTYLDVFDTQGRLVRSLLGCRFEARAHSVEWDRRDNEGALVSSGVYIYRLRAGQYVAQRKMILLP